jgi:hypothetical protein
MKNPFQKIQPCSPHSTISTAGNVAGKIPIRNQGLHVNAQNIVGAYTPMSDTNTTKNFPKNFNPFIISCSYFSTAKLQQIFELTKRSLKKFQSSLFYF